MNIPVKTLPSEYEADIQPYVEASTIKYSMGWYSTNIPLEDRVAELHQELHDLVIEQHNNTQNIMELLEKLLKLQENYNG